MKLLLDQNLSPRLVDNVDDLFPGSLHVRDVGLAMSSDEAVWRYATEHEFAVVSKDDDFRQMSFLRGAPPKVIWVRLGNCTTAQILAALRARATLVLAFGADPAAALLVIARESAD